MSPIRRSGRTPGALPLARHAQHQGALRARRLAPNAVPGTGRGPTLRPQTAETGQATRAEP